LNVAKYTILKNYVHSTTIFFPGGGGQIPIPNDQKQLFGSGFFLFSHDALVLLSHLHFLKRALVSLKLSRFKDFVQLFSYKFLTFIYETRHFWEA